jgi:MYXO-CTERM domain-containing protein
MLENAIMKSLRTFAVLFAVALCLIAGQAQADVGGGIADAAVAPPNDHWEGTIPEGAYQAISTDAALPLPLTLVGWSQTEATALSFITVTVSPKDSADVTIAGALSYHTGLGLVLWQPAEPLSPLTTYTVSVLVDNEGLSALGFQTWANIIGDFEVTTGADALPLGALPVLDEPTVSYGVTTAWAECPSGQAICDANGSCMWGVSYERPQAGITLTWRDGEADGQELFFTYNITEAESRSWLANVAGAEVLDSAHTRTLMPYTTTGDAYCFEVEAFDLRVVAAADPSVGSFKVLRCVSLADKPADPDISALLAACAPVTTGDDISVTDITDINNALDDQPPSDTSSSRPDANDLPDTSSGGDAASGGDDSGCGCTTTRSPQGQPPVGLLLGLAAAFGAALSLRRRKAHEAR